jgi:DNA ligase (NAD+)
MGDLSASNLLNEIERSKETTLPRFIFALGIYGVGESTAKDLAKYLGSLIKIRESLPEILQYIPDIGREVSGSIYAFFSEKHNQEVIDTLLKFQIQFDENEKVDSDLAEKPTLVNFIKNLNFKDVGEVTAAKLAEKFGKLSNFIHASKSELMSVVKESVADLIVEYFSIDANKKHCLEVEEQLKKFGMHWENRSEVTAVQIPFKGKTFVVTGTLPTLTRGCWG